MVSGAFGPKSSNLPVALALTASIVAGGLPAGAAAQDAGAAPARDAKDAALVLGSGAVGGRIVDLDGKTAIAAARVAVIDTAGKTVVETKTAADGTYDLGKLAAGKYTLQCGRAAGRLVVQDSAAARSLTVVLPSAIALASPVTAALEEMVTLFGIEMAKETAILIGVAAAVVTAGAVVGGLAAGGVFEDDDDRPPPSPSNP